MSVSVYLKAQGYYCWPHAPRTPLRIPHGEDVGLFVGSSGVLLGGGVLLGEGEQRIPRGPQSCDEDGVGPELLLLLLSEVLLGGGVLLGGQRMPRRPPHPDDEDVGTELPLSEALLLGSGVGVPLGVLLGVLLGGQRIPRRPPHVCEEVVVDPESPPEGVLEGAGVLLEEQKRSSKPQLVKDEDEEEEEEEEEDDDDDNDKGELELLVGSDVDVVDVGVGVGVGQPRTSPRIPQSFEAEGDEDGVDGDEVVAVVVVVVVEELELESLVVLVDELLLEPPSPPTIKNTPRSNEHTTLLKKIEKLTQTKTSNISFFNR